MDASERQNGEMAVWDARTAGCGMLTAVGAGGTVTFLFTDIVQSTARWEQDPRSMSVALVAHDELLRGVVEEHSGQVFKHTGDGVCAVFASAQDAVDTAIAAQRALELPVRMGVHTGFVESRGADFFGPVLNRTARIMAAGHGGQILLSAATRALVEGVETTDLGEHRLRDLTTAEHLFQVGQEQFPPLTTVSSFRTNVREPLSSFVGRERELTAVGELLATHRIVTLTGAGGSGKTRLALRAAVAHGELFPDGVWVLELAPLADGASFPAALGSVLEVLTQPGQAVIDRVVEFLADRQALLVVDNCEHVPDAAAELVQRLLEACPKLVVLATSREALRVDGEHTFAVPTMSNLDAEMSDGVRLFVERVQEERAGFELTDNNRESVETICARLDHLPLAIELAAARAAAMGTSDIAGRLDERFRLLTAGQRGRIERHRTLQAAVEWSYALLDADERAVFDLLAVFAGTFDLDAALAVCAVEGLDDFQVIDAVGSLVAKSMVVIDEHPTLGARYRLLETLRAYGLERLEATERLDVARTRHVDYYCQLAHAAAVDLWGVASARSGQQLSADAPDHRATHACLIASGRAEDAMVHATNLLDTAVWRGWREPAEWVRGALARPTTAGSPYRPAALAALAYYASAFDYDLGEAERLARDSIAARRDEQVPGEPVTLSAEVAMWYVALSRRDFDDAVQWGTRQFERAHRRQDAGNYLWGLGLRVLAWSYLGRYDDARMTADELERHFGPDPAPPLVWGVCFCQGTACACDDPPIAVELFERARDNALAAGLPFLAHVCRRDALAVNLGHLPPLLAAKAARDVLVDMWEDRDLFDIRIAVAHIMTVCVRAARLREAAIIDGWLGSDAIPLAPHYVARLATARSEIDAHLGDDATALRSQGAAWPPATIVEHMLTTLTSIAEGDEPPQTIRVSLPVQ